MHCAATLITLNGNYISFYRTKWGLKCKHALPVQLCTILTDSFSRHKLCLEVATVVFTSKLTGNFNCVCKQERRGLRHRSSAARLLRSWVRIPPRAWIFVCCECCVLSGRDLCDGLITRPEESYRMCCVVVWDQETSKTRRLKPANGLWKIQPKVL